MSRVGEIQISASALRHNVQGLRSLAPSTMQVAAVVKGNAYGHGLKQVVPVLEPLVDAFQIDDLDELMALRRITEKRALVFGFIPIEELDEAVAFGCELAIFDLERLEALKRIAAACGKRVQVHLKIDALLGRLGVNLETLPKILYELEKSPEIEVVSAYAHYANIEDTADPSHAIEQERVFDQAFELAKAAFPSIERHFSATSGLMARETPASKNNLCRLGIGIYGIFPSPQLAESHSDLELQPVLRWTSILAQVKVLPKGHPVGYGLSYITPQEMRIGIVSQGYADGYDRGLSSCGAVLVQGKKCPVIGRVAMNMFAVDLTAAPDANPENEVVLLGKQGEEEISAEEIAQWIGSINYEVVSRVSPLLSRRLT